MYPGVRTSENRDPDRAISREGCGQCYDAERMGETVAAGPSVQPGRIGRYEVLMDLSDDGFVSIVAARVCGPNVGPRLVELAKVEPRLAADAEVEAAFLAEARAAGRIRHDNFVHPTDTLACEDDLFVATELVHGVRLDELWQAARQEDYRIPLAVGLRIVLDVLAGLSAVHAVGSGPGGFRRLAHGDVTPSSVVVSARGVTRVIHSGLACATSRVGAIGRTNRRLAYKSPEQVRSGLTAVAIEPSADVFAVGALLWEMLTRRVLMDAASEIETVERIVQWPVAPLEEAGEGLVPEALCVIVAEALQKERELRFPSAAEFAAAIEAADQDVAAPEDVALVVDRLLGSTVDRRREQIVGRFEQAEQRVRSTSRPPTDSQVRWLGASPSSAVAAPAPASRSGVTTAPVSGAEPSSLGHRLGIYLGLGALLGAILIAMGANHAGFGSALRREASRPAVSSAEQPPVPRAPPVDPTTAASGALAPVASASAPGAMAAPTPSAPASLGRPSPTKAPGASGSASGPQPKAAPARVERRADKQGKPSEAIIPPGI